MPGAQAPTWRAGPLNQRAMVGHFEIILGIGYPRHVPCTTGCFRHATAQAREPRPRVLVRVLLERFSPEGTSLIYNLARIKVAIPLFQIVYLGSPKFFLSPFDQLEPAETGST